MSKNEKITDVYNDDDEDEHDWYFYAVLIKDCNSKKDINTSTFWINNMAFRQMILIYENSLIALVFFFQKVYMPNKAIRVFI